MVRVKEVQPSFGVTHDDLMTACQLHGGESSISGHVKFRTSAAKKCIDDHNNRRDSGTLCDVTLQYLGLKLMGINRF